VLAGLGAHRQPLVRLPGGVEMQAPSLGELSRELGIGRELAPHEEVDLLVVGAGPAGLGAAVYGAPEGLDTLVVESSALGGQAGTSRRIENYLGFPAGISGSELTGRAVMQARKFGARPASPYRAVTLEPGESRHLVRLAEGQEITASAVLLATGAQYRRLEVEGLSDYEDCPCSTLRVRRSGRSAARRALPSSVGETQPVRPPSGWRVEARSSHFCTAAPTCARRCLTTSCGSSSATASPFVTAARSHSSTARMGSSKP
jgi:NADPH-dependent 2,4-dienoyl-CoA reductase/sulfur reductase-like enzyme